MHPFIGSLGEEAPFYWISEEGGTIFLGKTGMWLNFVLFLSTTMLAVDWCFIFSSLCTSSTRIKLFLLFGLN